MVKATPNRFSATSVAKGSVVLSRAVEKNFAQESEISHLRHHVSVLSKRLHLITREKEILESFVQKLSKGHSTKTAEEGEPSGGVVAEEVDSEACPEGVAEDRGKNEPTEEVAGEEAERSEATRSVAMDWSEDVAKSTVAEQVEVEDDEPLPSMASDCNRFKMDLVPYDQEESIQVPLIPTNKIGVDNDDTMTGLEIIPSSLSALEKKERMVEIFEEEIARLKGKEVEMNTGLGSSGDEDAIIGGVIVAGGASQKAKKKNKRKRKGTKKNGSEKVKEVCTRCSADDDRCVCVQAKDDGKKEVDQFEYIVERGGERRVLSAERWEVFRNEGIEAGIPPEMVDRMVKRIVKRV